MVTKTILEIAEELDVSKQAIRYQMNKIDKKHLTKRHDGAILISAVGEMIIRENMGREQDSNSKNQQEDSKEGSKDQQINYEKILDMLEKELDRKDEDIKNLNARLEDQQRLLDQQQQLNLHHISKFQLEEIDNKKSPAPKRNTTHADEINEVTKSEKATNKKTENKGLFKIVRNFFNR